MSVWDVLSGDIVYSVRVLRRNPGFALVAILTLALGIGANTVTFGLLRTVMLKSLPHPGGERLVMVQEVWPSAGPGATSWPNFVGIRRHVRSFEDLAALRYRNVEVDTTTQLQRAGAAEVTSNFFSVLGSVPLWGRYFADQDCVPGAPRVVVLSELLWRRSFASDRDVVGRTVTIDGELHTIIGVAPADFRSDPFPGTALWMAMQPVGPVYEQGAIQLFAFGLLKAGVTLAAANAELDVAIQDLRAANPQRAEVGIGRTAQVTSMQEWEARDLATKVPVLSLATTLLLLIVCMNVASLFLAWTISRRREWATRIALGGGQRQIMRQILVLSLIIAASGTFAGVALAQVCILTMRQLAAFFLPYGMRLELGSSVLAYEVAVCAITALVLGTAPALLALRSRSINLHSSEVAANSSRGQRTASRLLVGVEVALSMVLVCCSGLLFRTLYNLEQQDLGILYDNVLAFETSAPRGESKGHPVGQVYYWTLLERLRGIPGVLSAGATNAVPIRGNSSSDHILSPGHFIPTTTRFALRGVMPGYFQTLGVAMLKGREFNETDQVGTLPVAVINDIAARYVFGNEDPVGQQIGWGNTVIGVYKSTAQGLRSEQRLPEIDLSIMQMAPGTLVYDSWATQPMTVLVRTAPGMELQESIRAAMREINPRQSFVYIRTLRTDMDRAVMSERFTLQLIASAGTLALVLAAVGIYGLMSYRVTQQRNEIGIRMALGASRSGIRNLIFRQVALVAGVGIVSGSALAFGAGRLLRVLLFKVQPYDPLTFLVVATLILAISFLAALIPAQRAASSDPMATLRHE